jgi:hypothetical protein
VTAQRWCIYIDILGFSQLWESEHMKALGSLRELMRSIYRIGTLVYPGQDERLFVHHMGDGFAIVSDFGERSLERPISIAIALMRCVASTDAFASATIAEGDFADITGCYPGEVRSGLSDTGAISLGAGIMTLSSVMGTAFIRAYRLNNDAPPGPFLTVSEHDIERIPSGLPVRATTGRTCAPLKSIDWVRAETALVSKITEKAGLSVLSPKYAKAEDHRLLHTV